MKNNPQNLYNFIYQKILFQKNSSIVFWGASLLLKDFLNKYSLDEFNILGIIDANSDKQGTFLDKYQIISPEKLKTLNDVVVLVTIQNNSRKVYKEISSYILKLKNNITLLPNVFSEFVNDNITESISSKFMH